MDVSIQNKFKNSIKFFLKGLLVFMIVYKNSPFIHYTFITSERIAILMAIGAIFIRNKGKAIIRLGKKSRCSWTNYILFQVILFFYSGVLVLLWGSGTGNILVEDIANFIILGIPVLFLLLEMIDNAEELMMILLAISLFQCFIILLGISNNTIANIIDNSVFNQSVIHMGGYASMREMGYPGGIACIASKGVLQLSLGSLACVFFILRDKRTLFNWIFFGIISVTMIAVARTGIIITFTLFVLIFINMIFSKRKAQLIGIISSFSILFCLGIIMINICDMSQMTEKITHVFRRVVDLIERGFYNSFFKWYLFGETTKIPELNWMSMIGIGITSGISGNGIAVNVDGGFLRMYAALGLPAAVVYYWISLKMLIKNINIITQKQNKIVAIGFFLVLLIGEFKEFYFYTRYMIILFFIFTILCERDEKKQRIKVVKE